MFGQWLENKMEEHKISATEIGHATDSHHNVVRSWIRNKNVPSSIKLAKLIYTFEKKGDDISILCKNCFDSLLNNERN